MIDVSGMDNREIYDVLCSLYKQELVRARESYREPDYGNFSEEMEELLKEWNDTGVDEQYVWEVLCEYRDYSHLEMYGSYDSAEEFGRNHMENSGYGLAEEWMEKYFDFEQYGNDILDDGERAFQCNDGTIIEIGT